MKYGTEKDPSRNKGEPFWSGLTQQTPKYFPKKMFGGSFNVKGTSRLINVKGMMNSDKYKAVLQTHLLPAMQRNFPDRDGIFNRILLRAILHEKCAHSSKKVD